MRTRKPLSVLVLCVILIGLSVAIYSRQTHQAGPSTDTSLSIDVSLEVRQLRDEIRRLSRRVEQLESWSVHTDTYYIARMNTVLIDVNHNITPDRSFQEFVMFDGSHAISTGASRGEVQRLFDKLLKLAEQGKFIDHSQRVWYSRKGEDSLRKFLEQQAQSMGQFNHNQ